MWIQKVRKHGSTLAIGLPAKMCNDLGIKVSDYILIKTLPDGSLQMAKVPPECVFDTQGDIPEDDGTHDLPTIS